MVYRIVIAVGEHVVAKNALPGGKMKLCVMRVRKDSISTIVANSSSDME